MGRRICQSSHPSSNLPQQDKDMYTSKGKSTQSILIKISFKSLALCPSPAVCEPSFMDPCASVVQQVQQIPEQVEGQYWAGSSKWFHRWLRLLVTHTGSPLVGTPILFLASQWSKWCPSQMVLPQENMISTTQWLPCPTFKSQCGNNEGRYSLAFHPQR